MNKIYKKILSCLLAGSCMLSSGIPVTASEVEYSFNTYADSDSYADDEELEKYEQKFENMTVEELNAYIADCQTSISGMENKTEENVIYRITLKTAWLAAARIAKLAGYPCSGKLVEYSVKNRNFSETSTGNKVFGGKIKKTQKFQNYLKTAKKYTSYTPSAVAFSKSDDKDLYYALRKVNLTFTRVKNGNNISYTAKVTDKFEFEREFNKSLFTTLVVNWAWLCQQTGVLHPISVGIIIKGLK